VSHKHRTAARCDENQPEIVSTLRAVPGITVQVGMDDILVGYKGRNYWYEIKTPDCVSRKTGTIVDSAKKASQIKLEHEWKGQYRIVWNVDQILMDLGIAAD